jgi:3-deoxy-7-phosphoheptulonate synthase
MSDVIHIAGSPVGGGHFALIAGPCAVESRAMMMTTALAVCDAGATVLRGGVYKPRSSPHAFQGLGVEGIAMLDEARRHTGLPFVTEVTDPRQLDHLVGVADALQVGARNMHNGALLTEIGRCGLPVILKRGLAATIDELLLAAEYVLCQDNPNVVLCERGIRTFETAYRFTLDVAAVAVLRERTALPVLVDPSHAAGRRDLVLPLSLAAVAAGADGLIVEVHPDPPTALCDGPQSLYAADVAAYARDVRRVARAMGSCVSGAATAVGQT